MRGKKAKKTFDVRELLEPSPTHKLSLFFRATGQGQRNSALQGISTYPPPIKFRSVPEEVEVFDAMG